MADSLETRGKNAGMNGVMDALTDLDLTTSGGTVLSTVSIIGTAFSIVASGDATNDGAIVFTLEVGDIGSIATQVHFKQSTNIMMKVDLDTTLAITHAGEATIAAGDLSVTL